MDKGYKVIVENWNKFLNEEEKVEEGIMDMFRQVGRDVTGALKGAEDMRREVKRLMRMYPGDDKFYGTAASLKGSLRAQGVNWMKPDAGGAPVVDPDEVEAAIDAYMENPGGRNEYDNFESTLLNLKNALDDFIAGKKRKK